LHCKSSETTRLNLWADSHCAASYPEQDIDRTLLYSAGLRDALVQALADAAAGAGAFQIIDSTIARRTALTTRTPRNMRLQREFC
jgi:hypothetical protein